MRRGVTTFQIVLAIVAVVCVVSALGYFAWEEAGESARRERAREAKAEGRPPPSPLFLTPKRKVSAVDILLAKREAVRTLLGDPKEIVGDIDAWDVGLELRVRYVDGVAMALLVSGQDAGRNERLVRRWLGIQPNDPVIVNGREWRVGPRPQEQDAIEVLVAGGPDRPAAPTRVAARQEATAGAPQPVSKMPGISMAIGTFPSVPSTLESICRKAGGAQSLEYSCDAAGTTQLLFEMDAARSWVVMTVVGAKVAGREESGCRNMIAQAFPDAEERGRGGDDERKITYYATKTIQAFVTWERRLDRPGSAPCSVVLCKPSSDGKGDRCRPQ